MRALVCKQYGSAEHLVIEETEDLIPGEGEIVVDIKAAAINFPDNLMIHGQYQVKVPPPFVPGGEAAGVVSALGAGVERFKVGDPVIVLPEGGAFAEQVKIAADRALSIPAGMGFDVAAGFSITYATTHHAYKDCAQLMAGETVLVLGAAGGVGVAAIELAKAAGAHVIAGASNAEKLEFAKAAGADHVVNYIDESLRERVKQITAGVGVDVVYDPVGGDLAMQAFKSLAWRGRYLVIGFASGQIPNFPANIALLKEAQIQGVWWGTWMAKEPKAGYENFVELMQLMKQGRIQPKITEQFAFEDYVAAFASITERRARGKVVLLIGA